MHRERLIYRHIWGRTLTFDTKIQGEESVQTAWALNTMNSGDVFEEDLIKLWPLHAFLTSTR